MVHDPHPSEVRQLVQRYFESFGASDDELIDLDETILIDDGNYVGRSYRTEGLMAMWMVSVGILQFYDIEGNMLLTVNLLEEGQPQRMVA